jgi:hypothetical protein
MVLVVDEQWRPYGVGEGHQVDASDGEGSRGCSGSRDRQQMPGDRRRRRFLIDYFA